MSSSHRFGSKTTSRLLPRRGVIVVKSAILMTVMMAFIGLAVDTGAIMYHKNQMQTAVDAAALAASQEITGAITAAGEGTGDAFIDANSIAVTNARQVAAEAAALNGVYINPNVDVKFGKRTYQEATDSWPIQWGASPYNVVGVTARRNNDDLTQPDGELKLSFGWALGKPSVELMVNAAAFVQARDIVVVMDYSGSMNYDSQFRPQTVSKLGQSAIQANLHEIWQDLGSPTYGNLPYTPDYATVTKTPGAVRWTGPTVTVTFSQTATNVKLVYTTGVQQTFTGGNSGQVKTFQGSGSNSGKLISQAMIKVGTNWTTYSFYDTATIKQALGLSSVPYPYPRGSWDDYINYCRDSTDSTSFYDSELNAVGYRRKFGLMTLVEFWVKYYKEHDETPDLWKTRHYPFHAIKEGTSLLCDFLSDLEFGDYLGLVTYDTTSRIETVLNEAEMPRVDISREPITNDYNAINNIQSHKQAGHYNNTTNIGDGLKDAITLLNNHRRYGARPTILLMTDGNANERDTSWRLPAGWDWDKLTDYDGDGRADYSTTDEDKLYAIGKAKEAVDQGFTVHTLSVGADADRDMMKAIAFMGGGIWIDVPGGSTVSAMQAQVLSAFRLIAANVPPPKLIQAQ